jgi:hypothetical protein
VLVSHLRCPPLHWPARQRPQWKFPQFPPLHPALLQKWTGVPIAIGGVFGAVRNIRPAAGGSAAVLLFTPATAERATGQPRQYGGVGSRILTPRPRPSAPTTRLKLCPLFLRLVAPSTAGAIIISRTPHTSPSQHFQRRQVDHDVKPPPDFCSLFVMRGARPLYYPHWVTRLRPIVRRTPPLPYAVKAKVASNHKHEVWKANKTLSAAAND